MSALAIDHRIADDQVVWAFGPKMTPVLEVDPGTVVTLAMKDGLNGQITREDQLVRDILTDLDLTHVNGATGPIAVRGAEPGDSLVVDILAIRTAASGVALVIPGVGQLHRHGLDARTKLFDVDGDTIHMNERISFPIRPMLGVMGVATGGGGGAQRLRGRARRQPRQPPARPGRAHLLPGAPAGRHVRRRRHARLDGRRRDQRHGRGDRGRGRHPPGAGQGRGRAAGP